MKRRTLIVIGAVTITTLVGIVLVRGRLLSDMGAHLVTQDPLRRSDAIAVLLGSFPDRVLEAAELYGAGYAPLIVLTRSETPPAYEELHRRGITAPEPHDLNQLVLLQEHIPDSAVAVLQKPANSTLAEVTALSEFLQARQLRSVILVTSRYHSTRASRLLREVAGDRLTVISRPTRYDTFQPEAWWRNRTDSTFVFLEYCKLAYHHVEPWLGANTPGVESSGAHQ